MSDYVRPPLPVADLGEPDPTHSNAEDTLVSFVVIYKVHGTEHHARKQLDRIKHQLEVLLSRDVEITDVAICSASDNDDQGD